MKWNKFPIILFYFLSVSCIDTSSQETGLELLTYSYIEYNNNRLQVEQVNKLKRLLTNLPKTQHKFYEKPEVILTGFINENSEPEFYSIFLQAGYVYPGYFLET